MCGVPANTVYTVEPVLKGHPIGQKNVVSQVEDRGVFGDSLTFIEIYDFLPQTCGPSRQVVPQGSDLKTGLAVQVEHHITCNTQFFGMHMTYRVKAIVFYLPNCILSTNEIRHILFIYTGSYSFSF